MDVKLLRIDSRLVHGQVANNWAGSLGAEAILAVSDGAANDELRKTLMLQTGGGKVKVHVLGVEKAARVDESKDHIEGLLALVVEPKDVNVGTMTFKQGTSQVSQAVYASPADVEAFKEIDSRGIKQYIQQVPSTASSDLMGALKEKGLL